MIFQLYSEPLQKLPPGRRGPWRDPAAGRSTASASQTYFDPLPFWYPPFEDSGVGRPGFPLHAITQRPMAMYHSWGSQNAWLRQIHGDNRLYMNRERGRRARHRRRRLGVDHSAITAAIKAQVRLMDGVNPDTVWTWNAIGKRAGAWNLAPDAPEATRGFLLNHLIAELLPEQRGRLSLSPTPIRSPARRPGTICACGSRRPHRPSRRDVAALRADRALATLRKAAGDPALRRRFPSDSHRAGEQAMSA